MQMQRPIAGLSSNVDTQALKTRQNTCGNAPCKPHIKSDFSLMVAPILRNPALHAHFEPLSHKHPSFTMSLAFLDLEDSHRQVCL